MTDSKHTKTLCTQCGHQKTAHDYVQHVLGACTAFTSEENIGRFDHRNQESKSDAERYRWLRSHFEDVYAVNEDGDLVVQQKAIGNPELDGRNLDEAIDAAIPVRAACDIECEAKDSLRGDSMSEFSAGQEFRIAYPFIKDTYGEYDGEEFVVKPTWRPGCRYEACGYYGDDSEAVADGQGEQILTVVDVHKPGKYPERVFYTVGWVSPEGRQFGKGKLHIATIEKFRRRTRGFMSHECMFEYRVASESEEA